MNKIFFLIISILAITSILLTNLYYGKRSTISIMHTLDQELRENTTANLKAVTPTIRNQLIQGNIREARAILKGWKRNNVLLGYKIIQEYEVIDSDLDDIRQEDNSNFVISIPITYTEGGKKWGEIEYYHSFSKIKRIAQEIETSFYHILVITTLIIISLIFLIFITIWLSTSRLKKLIEEYLKDRKTSPESAILKLVWSPLITNIEEMSKMASDWRLKYFEAEKSQAMTEVCRQVSHDIRSPLAALNMALEDLDELPENNRLILKMSIQRIQDIANNLLNTTNNKETTEILPTLLHLNLDEILSEKRLQYKSNLHLKIEGNLTKGFGLFSSINPSILKQVISNLVNNAVEAIPGGCGGFVSISLERTDEIAVIEIIDNGKGMPPFVLSQIGKKDFSYGKDNLSGSGYGIGLKHALDTISKWNGHLTVKSEVGTGTVVRIELPICESPHWFLSAINCQQHQIIVILDDDHEIHQLWKTKFSKLTEKQKVNVLHFTDPSKAKDWFQKNGSKNTIFLTDYEILGFKETGLDIIEELNIEDISVLVTSHYDDILKIHSNKKLKIIPKMVIVNTSIIS